MVADSPIQLLVRRWWILVLGLLLGLGAAVVLSASRDARYGADALVLLTPSSSPDNPTLVDGNFLDRARDLANERVFAEGLVRSEPDLIQLEGAGVELAVRAQSDADVLVFRAEADRADTAASAADSFAQVFVSARRAAIVEEYSEARSVVESRIEDLTASLESGSGVESAPVEAEILRLRADLDALDLSSRLAQGGAARQVAPAEQPGAPFSPRPLRDGVFGAVVGLFLASVMAVVVERLDDRLLDRSQLAGSGLPVVAEIPVLSELRDGSRIVEPEVDGAEVFRSLRSTLDLLHRDQGASSFVVTSTDPDEGKTTVLLNVAAAAARRGNAVLVVDGDVRRRRLSRLLEVGSRRSDEQVGGFTVKAIRVGARDWIDHIDLSEGDPGRGSVDDLDLVSLVVEAEERYDLVLLDTSPLSVSTEALVMGAAAGGALLVVAVGLSRRSRVERSVEQFGDLKVPLLGFVVNKSPHARTNYSYQLEPGDGISRR